MNYKKLEKLLVGRCDAELALRGMRRVSEGAFEKSVSTRFTGWVGLPTASHPGPGVLIEPRIGVMDKEVNRIVAHLQGNTPQRATVQSSCLVLTSLHKLIPGRERGSSEWVAASEEQAAEAARKIVIDVIEYGVPYMERLASVDALFKEMKGSTHRFVRPHESAVMCMLHGELEEAKRLLQAIARPIARDPTIWDDNSRAEVGFFEAFAAYFGVDLEFESWPVWQTSGRGVRVNIRDRGVVPQAVALAGREDLVASAVGLDDAQLTQIAELATKIVARGDELDPGRAVGLAAIEFLTTHPG